MDNQQAIEMRTLTTEDLAWLGGFLDSDGCISLSKRPRKIGMNYMPNVFFSNSNPAMIEEAHIICMMSEIGHHITWQSSRNKRFSKMKVGNVQIVGYKRCKKALETLLPYIRGKRDQASLMLEYIEYRLAKGDRPKFSYSKVDDDYYERLKSLKIKSAPETTRGGNYSRCFKI